ncbi:hypothetical protein [Nocardia salmonicida]|uniref:hypothetical protein n=1 Tax=Nocardia salmonicida TaxID=53431 RepID=UPI0037AEDBAD
MSTPPTKPSGPPSWVRITTALEEMMGPGRQAGTWTQFCCPVHENDGRRHRPSLGVKHFADLGKTKVDCYASCDDELILGALGLEVKDLYDRPKAPGSPGRAPRSVKPQRAPSKAERAIEAAGLPPKNAKADLGQQRSAWVATDSYDYIRADGSVAGLVRRREAQFDRGKDKEFVQRAWDQSTGRWEATGFDKIPYRLPQVREAIAEGDRVIWIVEGEKDVAAAESAGLVATTNAGGAMAWTPEHAQWLAGAPTVIIVADQDAPGYRRAEKVMSSLVGVVPRVRVVGAATGKDLHDHLQLGHEIGDLVPIPGLDPLTPIPALTPSAAGATASPGGNPMPEYLLAPSGDVPQAHSDELDHMSRNWGQFTQLLFTKMMEMALAAAMRRKQDLERLAAHDAEQAAAEQQRQEIERKAVEARLKKMFDQGLDNVPREILAGAVRDAAMVADRSPLATDALTRMAKHVRVRYGIDIDTSTGQVRPTEQLGAAPELATALQAAEGERADGARMKKAQDRMVEMVARHPDLSEEAKTELYAAVEAWRADPSTSRLDSLTKKLTAAKVDPTVRHRIRFVGAYLGQANGIEALSEATTFEAAMATRELRRVAEPLVDPGEEAKGRIDKLLVSYQDGLRIGGPTDRVRERLADEVSRLSPEDQKTARARGVSIRDNPAGKYKPLWPDHIDREELADVVQMYAVLARQAERVAAEAGSLEEVAEDGVVKRAAAARQKINYAVANGKGMHQLEKDQLAAVVADVDAGKTKVPALMFADERSAAALDRSRADIYARDNARVTRRKAERILESSAVPPGVARRAGVQLASLTDATVALGTGRISLDEHEQSQRLEKLDVTLTQLGVPEALRGQVKGVFENGREHAAIEGKQARNIGDAWAQREDGIVKSRMPAPKQHVHDRHERIAAFKRGLTQVGLTADQIAQQLAADSEREAPPSEAAAPAAAADPAMQWGGAGGMRSRNLGRHRDDPAQEL